MYRNGPPAIASPPRLTGRAAAPRMRSTVGSSRQSPIARARRGGGYWPAPRHEALLRAALLAGPAAAVAWRDVAPWLAQGDVDHASRRLLPVLAPGLARHVPPGELLSRLKATRAATDLGTAALLAAAGRLLGALEAAGVPTLVIKGGALAQAFAQAGAARPMSDVDIVVPTSRATAALTTLADLGWRAPHPVPAGFVRVQHAAHLASPDGRLRCDLHWHVYWECCGPGDDDDLWAASVPIVVGGTPTRGLAPADQLLHLCVHGSRRARRPVLLWIPDALLVLRAGGVDWSRLLAEAARRRFVLRAGTMLAYLRESLEAPVPDEVLAALERLPLSRFERLEYRVVNRPAGVLGELPAYVCNYRRLRMAGVASSPLDFARYLQHTWRLGSLHQALGGALGRAGRRLAGRPP